MLANYFADKLRSNVNSVDICDLYPCLEKLDNLLDRIKESDSIIMIGPCYVDSFPADTINLLLAMAVKKGILHGQSLYGFIQGGMPYVHTHEHGIKLLECFSRDEDVKFKGGFVMGGGAVLNGQPLDKIIGAKKIVPAVNKFIKNIKNNEDSPEELYKDATMKMPALATMILAFMMNQHIKRSFTKRGIDYKAPNPYMQGKLLEMEK